jgi:hypothetical protein
MGTKKDPGNHDCYAKAAPDEPMFILLARDPIAPLLIRIWADLKSQLDGFGPDGNGTSQVKEALQAGQAFVAWGTKQSQLYPWRQRLATMIFERETKR